MKPSARTPAPRRAGEFHRLGPIALVFIVAPSTLIVSVGILVLTFGERVHERVFGILIVSLAGVLVAGVLATLVYVQREASVARLQAEFIATVSHELRTPLTSIRMFVETLQMRRAKDPETERQCLDTIAVETARLSALIERLLDWARIDAGQRTYTTAPTRVEEVVDDALRAFGPQLVNEPAEVVRDIAPGLPRIDVDRDAMSEAVLNLLQNAHRYTGPQKRIAVRCAARGPMVEIRVEDNGPGIPAIEHRRVFEKFYRAADAVRRNIPGTGLGLAMVKSVVEAHRGTVAVAHDKGPGAAFVVSLPAVAA